MAGMDGNRTHPGRLSSAPQTVLKTAGRGCAIVDWRPQQFGYEPQHSKFVCPQPRSSASLAVLLAVTGTSGKHWRGSFFMMVAVTTTHSGATV